MHHKVPIMCKTEEDKINRAVNHFWQGWKTSLDSLLHNQRFDELNLDVISKIAFELITFYLHIYDRFFYIAVGPDKRPDIMQKIMDGVYDNLVNFDEDFLKNTFGEKSKENLTQYFNYLSRHALSINFEDEFNKRQIK